MFSQSHGYLIQSLGLVCDIVGAILLFKFGLPEIQRTNGLSFITVERENPEELERERRYDFWGKVGLALLIVGFFGQLLPNLNSWFWFS